jgi:hypothetical protein
MIWLTAGRVSPASAAALVKLWWRATRQKIRNESTMTT